MSSLSAISTLLSGRRWRLVRGLTVIGIFLFARLGAVTMDDLLNDSKMNPKRFAGHFSDFAFQFHPYVQDPKVFLSTESGDCADYAILGDYVLTHTKNYRTTLIRVVLVGGEAHDICYVGEAKAYLDYNLRNLFTNLQRSGRTIREIATKVAASFDENWTTASVFTYTYKEDVKHLDPALTIVKTDPPAEDPDLKLPSLPASK